MSRLSPRRWWILLALLFMSIRHVLLHANVLAQAVTIKITYSQEHEDHREWNTTPPPHTDNNPLLPLTKMPSVFSLPVQIFVICTMVLSFWGMKLTHRTPHLQRCSATLVCLHTELVVMSKRQDVSQIHVPKKYLTRSPSKLSTPLNQCAPASHKVPGFTNGATCPFSADSDDDELTVFFKDTGKHCDLCPVVFMGQGPLS